MKLRSRVAAIAAAAGLAAGLLIVGGGGVAHAQDTVLIECDHVGGSATVKPGLSAGAVANTAVATKGPLVAGTVPLKPLTLVGGRDCTGILATDNVGGPNNDPGDPDDTGNLVKVAGKLVGSATCNLTADPPITDPLDPLDGKLTLTYANSDPVTLKAYSSALYVRIGGGTNPLIPDELVINSGIVTKGVGVGADAFGSFIFAPYDAKTKADFDNNPATPVTIRPDQGDLNSAGDLVFGVGSLLIGTDCQNGVGPPLATAFFATDGTNLTVQPFNSSIGISLPAPT